MFSSISVSSPASGSLQHRPFGGKTIAIGVCGGIAAYRVCDLVRELYRQGASRVLCLMTQGAEAFIPAMTLESLSGQPVYRYDATLSLQQPGLPVHIKLAQEADLLMVMPATVNTIAKMANGLADDLLSTTFMTFSDKPVLIVPAMNGRMWAHPVLQDNLKRLLALPNVRMVSPVSGLLACGETGEGHLASQEAVLAYAYRLLHPGAGLLSGRKILVTAGGTREPIDPVRCLSNFSSGKMGLALADEAWAMGAEVTLLSSASDHQGLNRPYTIQSFSTFNELKAELEAEWPLQDWLLMAAAVSDFRPSQVSAQKIKKYPQSQNPDSEVKAQAQMLALEANPDLLAGLGLQKKAHQRLVGFAAESEDLLTHAQAKLVRKNLDAIVANDISQPGIGFQSDDNEVTLLDAWGNTVVIARAPKPMIAREILQRLSERFNPAYQKSTGYNASDRALPAYSAGTGS